MEQSLPSKFPSLSRRSLLAGGLAAIGTALGAKVAHDLRHVIPGPVRERHEQPFTDEAEFSEPHAEDPWETAPTVNEDEPADRRELTGFQYELSEFEQVFRAEFGNAETGPGGSATTQERTREFLLGSRLPERIRQIAAILVRYPSSRGSFAGRVYFDAMHVFSSCESQGLVYAAIKEASEAIGTSVSFSRNGGRYYASKLRDYVPTDHDIWSRDIDPRNAQHIPGSTRRNIEASPVWSGRRHKQIFRRLAERTSIVERAKREDLTIVEYFSLLKSVIHERAELTADQRGREAIEETVDRLLLARRATMDRDVLSANTEKAILFYGNDGRYMNGAEDGGWDGTIEAVGLPADRVERIGTSETRTSAAEELSKLRRAVATSRGKTFLSFKTHGANAALMIDQARGPEAITDQLLAEALFSRLQATRDVRTLGEVNIVIDACNSYTYTKNVVRILRQLWEVSSFRALPFSRVYLPFIVTAVQEGANGQAGSMISSRLDLQFSGIQEDRAVTGRRLLQNVQPSVYEESDMTFFAAETGTEFSLRRAEDDGRVV